VDVLLVEIEAAMVQEGHEWCRFAWGAVMAWQQGHREDGPGLGGWMEMGRWQCGHMIGSCGPGCDGGGSGGLGVVHWQGVRVCMM
jgi:hypothetical protein